VRPLLRLLGRRLPRVDGSLLAPVRAPLTIRRDVNGVAYIEAQNDHDAFFGLGFAQGQDRAFQLELHLRVGRGTLAELVGKEMLDVDRLARRIGYRRIAEAQLAVQDARTRADFEAFAAGVNAGIASGKKPHELALLGGVSSRYEAFDILALLQFIAFSLSSNWDAELARLHILQSDGPEALAALEAADPALLKVETDALGRLASDVSLLAAAERFATDASRTTTVAGVGGASNHWALAPSRTSTGRPLLVCDPHLTPSIPAPWYLAHVRTPDWAVSGAFFPGQPAASFGHNQRLGWGITSGHSDNTDLFVEKLGPDGQTALRGDKWVPCRVREERIRVKGGSEVVEKVVETPTGPIVTPVVPAGGTALSLRATWMVAKPMRAYQLHRARDVHEARACFKGFTGDSENRMFADVEGNIAWQLVGELPVRKKGHGLLPMPAWDESAGWEDAPLPFDKMPGATNPPEGFLATANAAPPRTPDFLGADWLDPGRHDRIHALLPARRDWDVASSAAMQLDRTTVYWARLRGPLCKATDPAPAGAETAARLLAGWDGVVDTGSVGAAVFELTFAALMRRALRAKAPNAWKQAIGEGINELFDHGNMAVRRSGQLARLLVEQPDGWFARGWRDEIRAALVEAQAELQAAAGPDPGNWAWGRVRPLTLLHATGKVPVLKRIFNVGPIPFGGDCSTLPQAPVAFDHPLGNPLAIPNLRMVLDVGNWEAGRWILAGGQSGNPLSPHYADMVPRWERGETVPIAWEPASVHRVAVATLFLRPA
jgi:penicillin G amidase